MYRHHKLNYSLDRIRTVRTWLLSITSVRTRLLSQWTSPYHWCLLQGIRWFGNIFTLLSISTRLLLVYITYLPILITEVSVIIPFCHKCYKALHEARQSICPCVPYRPQILGDDDFVNYVVEGTVENVIVDYLNIN